MKKKFFIRVGLIVSLSVISTQLFAKHDGAYLRDISNDYVTKHHKFFNSEKEVKPIKVFFALQRSGARDAIELTQRIPLDAEYFLTYFVNAFSYADVYESAIEGTSQGEKEQEALQKLTKKYDVYAIGNFEFTKFPQEVQFNILNEVINNGATLMIFRSWHVPQLPFGKLYQKELPLPNELKEFARDQKISVRIFQANKGKFIAVSGGIPRLTLENSFINYVPYSNKFHALYENNVAFIAALLRYAANRPLQVENPKVRYRDVYNQEVASSNLSAGTFFKDEIADNGAFKVTQVNIPSTIQKVTLSTPEVVNDKAPFTGELHIEKPFDKDFSATVELIDSPYGNIWYRQNINIAANSKKVEFKIANYLLPTLAGYVKVTLKNPENKVSNVIDKEVFFPNYDVDDYHQIAWDSVGSGAGDFHAPNTVDRLGWNMGLNHPSKNGENAKIAALLNQKQLPYTVRIVLSKGAQNSAKQALWFFVPPHLKDEVANLKGDESFFRPEVKRLWDEGIKYRIRNLDKYSATIYSLGDENSLDYESGFGPTDKKHFPLFLKDKYKTIENLNYNWQTNYASFDQVPHPTLKEAKAQGKFAAFADHRAYVEKIYADTHHYLAKKIKEIHPNAKVGAEGSMPGNLEQTMENLEYWGPYTEFVGDELLRSIGKDKIRSLWWGGYPGTHGGRGEYAMPLLIDMTRGTVNGNAWFAANPGYNHSAFACDLTIAKYVQKFLPDLDRMRYGEGQLLIRNVLKDDGLYFYWSHPSTMVKMLTNKAVDNSTTLIPLMRYAYRNGMGFNFVTAKTIDRLKKAKVVVLAGASALSLKECQALTEFVKDGGKIIADINPAIFNENMRPYEKNPLAQLFGNITFENAQTPELQALNLPDFKATRADVVGNKHFIRRKLGKGEAILLNFSLTTASNNCRTVGHFDKWASTILPKPCLKVENLDENGIIRLRQGKDFTIISCVVPVNKMSESVKIVLPNKKYVYHVNNKFLANSQEINIKFPNSPMQSFALFDKMQVAPKFAIKETVRGKKVELSLPELESGRVYYLQVFAPNKKVIYTCVFDRKEIAPKFAIPYNQVSGHYSAKLTDIATGLNNKQKFEVK